MPSAIGVWSLPIDQQTIDVYRKGELDASERQVNKVFLASKVPYKVIQVAGHAVEGILKTAKSKNADLIVVGSRGMSRMQEVLLGSVSHGVVLHSECSVMVERNAPREIKKILVAYDSSETAKKAFTAASELSTKLNAELTVLNVVNSPLSTPIVGTLPTPVVGYIEEFDCGNRKRAILNSLKAKNGDSAVRYCLQFEVGHSGRSIVNYADSNSYDLIVIRARDT